MSEPRIRRRAVIEGRVHGVCFRAWTLRQAERAGLVGWVRNRPDGSVEAAFEGPPAAVEAMLLACRRGPIAAAVKRMEAVPEPPTGETGFRILH